MGFSTMEELLSWLYAHNQSKTLANLRLVVAHAIIYSLLGERNNQIFKSKCLWAEDDLFKTWIRVFSIPIQVRISKYLSFIR